MSNCRSLAALALIVGLSAAPVSAQGSGTFVGTLVDASGAVVPGAKVVATNEATQSSREAASNEQGYYVLTSLPPATYDLKVEANGFALISGSRLRCWPNIDSHNGLLTETHIFAPNLLNEFRIGISRVNGMRDRIDTVPLFNWRSRFRWSEAVQVLGVFQEYLRPDGFVVRPMRQQIEQDHVIGLVTARRVRPVRSPH